MPVPITSACHTRYASSNQSGFLNAAAKVAGRELPVEVAFVWGAEPSADPEEERELDAVDPPGSELPPAVEPPSPAVEPPPPPEVFAVEREWRSRAHEEEVVEEREEGGRPRSGRGVAGAARESTYTSPRMCSTNWAGTPDGLTGWVNTTCTPVALTMVSWLEPVVPSVAVGLVAPGVTVVPV